MLPTRLTRRAAALTLLLPVLAACAATSESAQPESSPAFVWPASASAVPSTESDASQAAPAGSGPCALLDAAIIEGTVGGVMPDGQETLDDVRQVQMCTWTSTDPVIIAVVALTDVDAQEAFDLNVELAPAYFDGEAVPTTVAGADQAYAVHQPDVGWVVGAIAAGRFVQVQVGGETVTQEQVEALTAEAVSRLAA